MFRFKPSHALPGALLLIASACATSEVSRPPESAPAAPPPAKPVKNVFPATMSVCPGMTVSNRPATDANLVMTGSGKFIEVPESLRPLLEPMTPEERMAWLKAHPQE